MRALYDKEADALQIDLYGGRPIPVHTEDLPHGTSVGVDGAGRAVEVEVLVVTEGLQGLDAAAEKYGIARDHLEAAARAALEVPGREVTVEVSPFESSPA